MPVTYFCSLLSSYVTSVTIVTLIILHFSVLVGQKKQFGNINLDFMEIEKGIFNYFLSDNTENNQQNNQ